MTVIRETLAGHIVIVSGRWVAVKIIIFNKK
jgi:hypothetical protein